jgi:hypothetical protein
MTRHLLIGGHVVLGALLLAAPDRVLRRVTQRQIGTGERMAARVLGIRNLAEGAILARHPSCRLVLGGAAVDATHAPSMVALAAARPEHRRPATASALTATSMAAAGLVAATDIHRRRATEER